jgi:hypothetical protein
LGSLEDCGGRSTRRSTISQRPQENDVSQKLGNDLRRFYEGHQTQNLTSYLDMMATDFRNL